VTRTAVVTGCASGIGAAVAATLEREGYRVAGLDLNDEAPYCVDVSDPGPVAEALRRVAADFGPIDAVVSAAGHYAMVAIADITREQLHRMLRVHLGGLRNVVRCVLPSMIERRRGAKVAEHGIRVNAVAPGPTDTPLLSPESPWRAPEYLAILPARRLARPDEVAEVVRYLVGDDAGFCTGEVISPNSGAVI
jgi:NAD(P)-dependent dehydrogenase (short-subunit alcohol dehydrogenase family)